MSDRTPAPEGVEYDISVYLTSSDGVEAVVAMRGMSSVPTFDRSEAAILSAKLSLAPLSDAEWRVMTRAEIADYKDRENNPSDPEDDDDLLGDEF